MNLRLLTLSIAALLPLGLTLSPSAPFEGPRPALAAVAVQLSLEELTSASSLVVVATPQEQTSIWEDLPSGRRIVTYTKLKVDRGIVGEPEQELWVRTLGGVVDKIGQSVSGEARLVPGEKALLFLAKTKEALVVTALAQGHYRLVQPSSKDQPVRLAPSPDAGTLLPRRGPAISAREELVGKTVDEAVQAISRARRSHDEKK